MKAIERNGSTADGVSVEMSPGPAAALDETSLAAAVDELAALDADLAGIADRHGPPPLWDRPPGFETLVGIVLEQQVSLRSGAAALERLRVAAGALEPAAVVALGEDGARAAGITRQKSRYVVNLAGEILSGGFEPADLADANDDDVRARLVRLLGIGRWTADIYLLMALGRPDVWPDGDLALATAMRRAKRLAFLPDASTQRALAQAWRPWRAVAARLLWHAYLQGER
jgi:DNA-3-methyladenine glycosylase II